MSATNDDCGAIFGAHRCDACGTSIIYPLGSVPEPCQRCRIAALESELAASQAREKLRPPIEWTPNADAGDHSGHCSACGQVRDDPHTLNDCLVVVSSERDAALDELSASEAREARLRAALTELERAASAILEHVRLNRADTASCAQHNSRIAGANRAVREARAALAAGGEGDAPATVSRVSVVQVLGKLMARCQDAGLPTQGDELCDALNKGRRGAFAYAAKWLREATGIGVDEGQRVAEQIAEAEAGGEGGGDE